MSRPRNKDFKPIKDCTIEEIGINPMNLHLYAIFVIKDKLPEKYHKIMEDFRKKDPDDQLVNNYFDFIGRNTLFGKIKKFFGKGYR